MPRPAKKRAAATAWEDQAACYDQRHGEHGDLHHRKVVLPAVLRQLPLKPGQRVLDCCCGQGVLGRLLAVQGVRVLGIDAAPSLIDAAQAQAGELEEYRLADATCLAEVVEPESIDHAAVVLALQDVADEAALLRGVARTLKPGGRCVAVVTHPCFRVPGASDWGFDQHSGRQFRRIERYLQAGEQRIATHPGRRGKTSTTTHHHRPLSQMIADFAAADLPIIACEELCSPKRGSDGRRSAAEDQAAREIPVFLLLVGARPPAASVDG